MDVYVRACESVHALGRGRYIGERFAYSFESNVLEMTVT